LLKREHGRPRILAGRFDRREIKHRFFMCVHRLPHGISAFLQSSVSFTGPRNLSVQGNDAVNGCSRIFRHLPLLPCNIQIHRAEILPRSRLFRQKGNERAEFPACAEIVGSDRAGGVPSGDVVARVGNDNIRQNPSLDQLRHGESASIANAAQSKI